MGAISTLGCEPVSKFSNIRTPTLINGCQKQEVPSCTKRRFATLYRCRNRGQQHIMRATLKTSSLDSLSPSCTPFTPPSRSHETVGAVPRNIHPRGQTTSTEPTQLSESQPLSSPGAEDNIKSLLLLTAVFSAAGILSACQADVALADALGVTDQVSVTAVLMDILQKLEEMGDSALIYMLGLITVAEMIPLFPTQPITIATGLLFGWKEGIPVALLGTTMAATAAFMLSRTFGTKLLTFASSRAAALGITGEVEMLQEDGLQARLRDMKSRVETGGAVGGVVKIMLMRLSPVVPYSISNYLMGLTELPYSGFLAGTLLGMAPWMIFYAGLGSTGRSVLLSGGSFGSVLEQLLNTAEADLEGPIIPIIVFTCVALGYFFLRPTMPDRDPDLDA